MFFFEYFIKFSIESIFVKCMINIFFPFHYRKQFFFVCFIGKIIIVFFVINHFRIFKSFRSFRTNINIYILASIMLPFLITHIFCIIIFNSINNLNSIIIAVIIYIFIGNEILDNINNSTNSIPFRQKSTIDPYIFHKWT